MHHYAPVLTDLAPAVVALLGKAKSLAGLGRVLTALDLDLDETQQLDELLRRIVVDLHLKLTHLK